jgi:hypothetical protein
MQLLLRTSPAHHTLLLALPHTHRHPKLGRPASTRHRLARHFLFLLRHIKGAPGLLFTPHHSPSLSFVRSAATPEEPPELRRAAPISSSVVFPSPSSPW